MTYSFVKEAPVFNLFNLSARMKLRYARIGRLWRSCYHNVKPIPLELRAKTVLQLFEQPLQHFRVVLADFNGEVQFADFLIVANNFDQVGKKRSEGEFNSRGAVQFEHFTILGANFGKTVQAQ